MIQPIPISLVQRARMSSGADLFFAASLFAEVKLGRAVSLMRRATRSSWEGWSAHTLGHGRLRQCSAWMASSSRWGRTKVWTAAGPTTSSGFISWPKKYSSNQKQGANGARPNRFCGSAGRGQRFSFRSTTAPPRRAGSTCPMMNGIRTLRRAIYSRA